jgi:RHS repeat-associated protein
MTPNADPRPRVTKGRPPAPAPAPPPFPPRRIAQRRDLRLQVRLRASLGGYDQLGRVTSDVLRNAANAVTASYGYGYDADGNVTSMTTTLPGNPSAGVNSFGYDRAGRLVSWTKPGGTTASYLWDAAGNLTGNAGTASVFDERNRLVSSGATAYSWSARGTLQSTVTGGVASTHGADGLGRQVVAAGVAYSYDSLDRVVTSAGSSFAYAGVEIDPAQIDQLRVARSPSGAPLAVKQGAAAGHLVGRNRHGDVGYQFGPDGAVAATRVFDPFGATLAQTGSVTALGFQGDFTAGNGDVWMGARWYRPGTGSFLSRDTVHGKLSTPVSLNRYTYGNADPLGMWDPDGRTAERADEPETVKVITGNEVIDIGSGADIDVDTFSAIYSDYRANSLSNFRAALGGAGRFLVVTAVKFTAASVCGTAAGALTGGNAVVAGGAAGFCGGAAGRAATAAFNGQGLQGALGAAFNPAESARYMLVGAVSGGIAGRGAGTFTNNVIRNMASEMAGGALADLITTRLQGGTWNQGFHQATNLTRRAQDATIATASTVVSHLHQPQQPHKTNTDTPLQPRTTDATKSGTSLVPYDENFAAAQILGRPSNVTPGGRTITPHAAEQMTMPPGGRVVADVGLVDTVLDKATQIKKISPHPLGTTVQVRHPGLPGGPSVVVDAETGTRVVTVIAPRPK